ncbi:hypothetical protein ACFRMN_11725 [Streptomyces sp. NPDC056835]|uniref:hypothetical protein n=1 Tax=Streptomyces sp. NPDC056835 TaxID=3345956 RepID=UPI0036B32C09
MAEVEEVLDDVAIRMPSAAEIRARGSRRRARRRLSAVTAVAAVVIAGGSWVLQPGPGGDEVRPAAPPAEANPYRKNGVVETMDGRDVPLFGTYHWKKDSDAFFDALPLLGFSDACPYTLPPPNVEMIEQFRYSAAYDGAGTALARHRVIEYDDADQAAEDLAALRDSIAACGLKQYGEGKDAYYAGNASKGGQWLRVSVEHGRTWTSVVEVQSTWE